MYSYRLNLLKERLIDWQRNAAVIEKSLESGNICENRSLYFQKKHQRRH